MAIDPQVSKYMGELAKKSWANSRSKNQNMKDLGKQGALKRWKNHEKKVHKK